MSDLLDPPLPLWPIDSGSANSVVGPEWLRWFGRVHDAVTKLAVVAGLQMAPVTITHYRHQRGSVRDERLVDLPETTEFTVNWYIEGGTGCEIRVTWMHQGRVLMRSVLIPGAPAWSETWPLVIDPGSKISYSVIAAGSTEYFFSIWAHA